MTQKSLRPWQGAQPLPDNAWSSLNDRRRLGLMTVGPSPPAVFSGAYRRPDDLRSDCRVSTLPSAGCAPAGGGEVNGRPAARRSRCRHPAGLRAAKTLRVEPCPRSRAHRQVCWSQMLTAPRPRLSAGHVGSASDDAEAASRARAAKSPPQPPCRKSTRARSAACIAAG